MRGEYRERYSCVGSLGRVQGGGIQFIGAERLELRAAAEGLLLFHKYADTVRTAMEEHLAEGAMYAKNNAGEVNIHFTVSPEHQALFEQLVADKSGEYEEKFSVKYDVSFSIQKPSTDTVAAAMDNTPFAIRMISYCSVRVGMEP